MATQTWVNQTFEPANADLLTKTTADTLYQPIGDYATKTDVSTATNDMLTKTEASQTYEPKNDDLATKTWVGQQGYLNDDTNYVKHSEVYVQNGILYINL